MTLLFPCRPAQHERPLQMGAQALQLRMHSCEAEGTLWALSWADVGDPRQVGAALAQLKEGLARNLGAKVPQPLAFQPAGSTPQAESAELTLSGRTPDDRPVWARTAVFAHATRVFQLTALGPKPITASQTFFESARVTP